MWGISVFSCSQHVEIDTSCPPIGRHTLHYSSGWAPPTPKGVLCLSQSPCYMSQLIPILTAGKHLKFGWLSTWPFSSVIFRVIALLKVITNYCGRKVTGFILLPYNSPNPTWIVQGGTLLCSSHSEIQALMIFWLCHSARNCLHLYGQSWGPDKFMLQLMERGKESRGWLISQIGDDLQSQLSFTSHQPRQF